VPYGHRLSRGFWDLIFHYSLSKKCLRFFWFTWNWEIRELWKFLAVPEQESGRLQRHCGGADCPRFSGASIFSTEGTPPTTTFHLHFPFARIFPPFLSALDYLEALWRSSEGRDSIASLSRRSCSLFPATIPLSFCKGHVWRALEKCMRPFNYNFMSWILIEINFDRQPKQKTFATIAFGEIPKYNWLEPHYILNYFQLLNSPDQFS